MSDVSIWNGDPIPSTAINADSTFKSQAFSGFPEGTLTFTITAFAYAPGTNSLLVFVNGAKQSLIAGDFTETSPSSFTFSEAPDVDDYVEVYGMVGSEATQSAEASAAAAAISAAAALSYLNAIIALTPPSLPLPIASGGTGQITKTLAFNALSPVTTKGDLIVRDATNNIRFPAGADFGVLTPLASDANGVIWRPEKPRPRDFRNTNATLQNADAGKLIDVFTTSGSPVTISLASSLTLYPGWSTFVRNDQASSTDLIINLADGVDNIEGIGQSFKLPPFSSIGIQCDGNRKFTTFAAQGGRGYIKFRDQRASGTASTGVSSGTPVLGLNQRIINTVSENTFPAPYGLSGNVITLGPGTYQYRVSAIHSGTALTRLYLYFNAGPTLVTDQINCPASQFSSTIQGRISSSGTLQLIIQEYYSAAGGTFGLPLTVAAVPEIYLEAEFWRD